MDHVAVLVALIVTSTAATVPLNTSPIYFTGGSLTAYPGTLQVPSYLFRLDPVSNVTSVVASTNTTGIFKSNFGSAYDSEREIYYFITWDKSRDGSSDITYIHGFNVTSETFYVKDFELVKGWVEWGITVNPRTGVIHYLWSINATGSNDSNPLVNWGSFFPSNGTVNNYVATNIGRMPPYGTSVYVPDNCTMIVATEHSTTYIQRGQFDQLLMRGLQSGISFDSYSGDVYGAEPFSDGTQIVQVLPDTMEYPVVCQISPNTKMASYGFGSGNTVDPVSKVWAMPIYLATSPRSRNRTSQFWFVNLATCETTTIKWDDGIPFSGANDVLGGPQFVY